MDSAKQLANFRRIVSLEHKMDKQLAENEEEVVVVVVVIVTEEAEEEEEG